MPPKPSKASAVTLTGNPLLVCEGYEEWALVEEMMAKGLVPQFDFTAIGDQPGKGTGITGLKDHLVGLAGLRDFSKVTKICLLVDSDDSPTDTFKSVKEHIRKANKELKVKAAYPMPKAAFKTAKRGSLSLTVILQPGRKKTGCLETLLWDVFSRMYSAEAKCVDAFIRCAGIDQGTNKWGKSKIDKAKIRAGIAVRHKKNPAKALSRLWEESSHLIPVMEPEFKKVISDLASI
jgi:hypothetical protein